jgi:hypothetical protein
MYEGMNETILNPGLGNPKWDRMLYFALGIDKFLFLGIFFFDKLLSSLAKSSKIGGILSGPTRQTVYDCRQRFKVERIASVTPYFNANFTYLYV